MDGMSFLILKMLFKNNSYTIVALMIIENLRSVELIILQRQLFGFSIDPTINFNLTNSLINQLFYTETTTKDRA